MRLILFCLLFITSAYAHQTSVTASGKPLYWVNKNIPLAIRTNTNDLNPTASRSIILDSIAQWNASSSAKIQAVTSSNNEIKFSSDFSIFGPAVIGVTQVTYNTAGAIQNAVIFLNDNYYFSTWQDSFADGSYFLGDVVTHELGHLFGLSHSEVLNSSMFYTTFPGQSTVEADDRSAIRSKYGPQIGSISGTVKGGRDIGILGVHVQAISRKTGDLVGVVSDADGKFRIAGLDLNDSYYLYTSPIKNVNSLPGYFSNLQTTFCPASYVGSFFTACGRENDGLPQAITLSNSVPEVDVGAVTIHCSLRASDEYSYQKINSSFAPITIWESHESSRRELSYVGFFNKRNTAGWTGWETLRADLSGLPTTSGRSLKLKLITHPFGNLLEYEMKVLRNDILVAEEGMKESHLLGTNNTNIFISLPLSINPSENIFEIQIRARRLENYLVGITFPSASQFASSTHLPHLLVLSVEDGQGLLFGSNQPLLSDNQACLDAPFSFKVNNAKEKNPDSLTNGDAAAVGASCATIEPPNSGPGSALPLLALGFFLALSLASLTKKTKNFLS